MFLPNSEAIQLMKQKRLSVFLRNNQYISVCICFIPQNSCTENKQIIYQCVIVTSKRENIKKIYISYKWNYDVSPPLHYLQNNHKETSQFLHGQSLKKIVF